jgi:hypothetical protein
VERPVYSSTIISTVGIIPWTLIKKKSVLQSDLGGVCTVQEPITVASRYKAWTVFARSNTGIEGSNPTHGTPLFCVCVVLRVGSGIVTGLIPRPKSPTDYVYYV